MAGNSAFARYRRRLASRTVHGLWDAALRAGTITPENLAGHPFRAFGMGSLIGFPTGALYGEKWIEIGAGTMIGAQVSLSAGMVPGQDLGEAPVLRIGDRCIIGRGSHIVAHYSIVIGDLRRGQVALQPALPGGAERAGHPAPGLAGHTDRRPVGVTHDDAFKQGAVVGPPQGLAGSAAVAADLAHRREQRRQHLAHQPRPGRSRYVGHAGLVHAEPAEVVVRQLPGAQRLVPQRGDRLRALLRRQVSQVTRWQAAARGLEDQRK